MKNNESILSLTGDEKKAALDELSQGGKVDVKELTVKSDGKEYRAIIAMDFALFRKALTALIDTEVTGGKNSQKVSVNVDEVGAGDKVLFMGWKEGDDEIKQNMKLRIKACKVLGKWVQELANDDEDSDEEKKS